MRFSIVYAAHLERLATGQRSRSKRLLALCDGVCADDDLAELMSEHELPDGLGIRRVTATLRWHAADSRLLMELEFEASRTPSAGELAVVSAVATSVFENWNYEFELPDALGEYQVHFETRPAATIDDPLADELAALAQDWPSVPFERVAALSDAELEALIERLRPFEKRVCKNSAAGDAAKVRDLIVACRSHKQRRASARLPPDPETL